MSKPCKLVVTSLLTSCVCIFLFHVVGRCFEQVVLTAKLPVVKTTFNKLDGTIRRVTDDQKVVLTRLRKSSYNNTVAVLCCQLCDNLVITGLYQSC